MLISINNYNIANDARSHPFPNASYYGFKRQKGQLSILEERNHSVT